MIRILHTADWHIGKRRGPVLDGVNLREKDTEQCIEALLRTAEAERPDIVMVSGDLIDVAGTHSERGHHEERVVFRAVTRLAECSGYVIVMRGTPNHDGGEFFLALSDYCRQYKNVSAVMEPGVVHTECMDVACIPGFDIGYFRAKFAGLSREEENEAFASELGNICAGLKELCSAGRPSALMAHYTVPGCNMESGQSAFLQKFEPVLSSESLHTAGYDIVCLGHIHRPQKLRSVPNAFYCGAVNALNFGDEGQERGFYIHEFEDRHHIESRYIATPYRKFFTVKLGVDDIRQINNGALDMVAAEKWSGKAMGKIVRVFYDSTEGDKKALNKSALEKKLLDDGAFMVWDIAPQTVHADPNKKQLGKRSDPEENLKEYLAEKGIAEEKIPEIMDKARPVIQNALAYGGNAVLAGEFSPVSIEVKNYRNYATESFDFSNISFCTINGPNGAGKSSFFMDAIIDCLYEEPREGDIAGWIRKADGVRSGSITFLFRIGDRTYRVSRSRTRSRTLTLGLSEQVDGEWESRTCNKSNDTQKAIEQLLGMDCMTFKSCALIMQDQYGLFLQADKKERMGILSRLLGLEIYDAMRKEAGERAKEYGGKKKEAQHEIEIHEATLKSYGAPKRELKASMEKIRVLSGELKGKTAERDVCSLSLMRQKEAMERRDKLISEINALQDKRVKAERNMDAQREIIRVSSIALNRREEIEAGVLKYTQLLEMEKNLSNKAVLYSAKKEEAESLRRQEAQEEESVHSMRVNALRQKEELDALRVTEKDDEIRARAKEHERYIGLIENMEKLQVKRQEALTEKERRAHAVDSKRAYINQEKKRMEEEKNNFIQRMELLKNSGCLDIENAKCRFLEDALQAKEKLPELEKKMAEFFELEGKKLEELELALKEAERDSKAVGYDEEKLLEYRKKAADLSGAPAELREMEKREGRIAVEKIKLENIHSNLKEAEKRLEFVKAKADTAEKARDEYAQSFLEYEKAKAGLLELRPWLEKEKHLPIAEERKNAAQKRILELQAELNGINAETNEKQKSLQKEIEAVGDVCELEEAVERKEQEIARLDEEIGQEQKTIGSLQQKIKDAQKAKDEIEDLQEKVNKYSEEAVDYETLKDAFSHFGIPHQIVRTVLPQIETTASQIIGQMTGGKMGISFQTERVQTSNKKEVLELDVLIDEFGKTTLPYLSKSGGEKVKASLSVILALAETKLSSAGVRLGMLFIDEPPFLDGDGVQAYCDALEAIQKRYDGIKIMAITHDPTMKARFPQSIDVVKTDEGSKVVY